MCKQDCDFSSLIAAGYTNDIPGFYKNISKFVPANVSVTCGQTTTPMLTTTTTSPILISIGIKINI